MSPRAVSSDFVPMLYFVSGTSALPKTMKTPLCVCVCTCVRACVTFLPSLLNNHTLIL